jgi:hypothetical protein
MPSCPCWNCRGKPVSKSTRHRHRGRPTQALPVPIEQPDEVEDDEVDEDEDLSEYWWGKLYINSCSRSTIASVRHKTAPETSVAPPAFVRHFAFILRWSFASFKWASVMQNQYHLEARSTTARWYMSLQQHVLFSGPPLGHLCLRSTPPDLGPKMLPRSTLSSFQWLLKVNLNYTAGYIKFTF